MRDFYFYVFEYTCFCWGWDISNVTEIFCFVLYAFHPIPLIELPDCPPAAQMCEAHLLLHKCQCQAALKAAEKRLKSSGPLGGNIVLNKNYLAKYLLFFF